MRDINDIRQDINEVDEDLSKLFEKRMELSKEVAVYKKASGKPIYDPEREKEVIASRKKAYAHKDEHFLQALETFYTTLMSLSKEEQQRILQETGSGVKEGRKAITIYTDGACKGNPGRGGYGCVLMYENQNGQISKKELSGGFSKTTNNRMELFAVIAALEMLKEPCRIKLYSDSQYLVNAFTLGWVEKWQKLDWHRDQKRQEKVKNIDLWQRLMKAAKGHEITYIWVKGHAQNQWNNRCDELAVNASNDLEHLEEDIGYSE